jgi:hypothetical protein
VKINDFVLVTADAGKVFFTAMEKGLLSWKVRGFLMRDLRRNLRKSPIMPMSCTGRQPPG